MPRRGENIYKRKDGRWEGRYIADRKPDGKAVYRSIYGTSYAQVRERLVAKRQETHKRQIGSCKLTVNELLALWQAENSQIKATSRERYRALIELHIQPELGARKVRELNEEVLDAFVRKKLKSGRLDGRGGLAPKTVRDICIVMKSALKLAKRKYRYSGDGGINAPAIRQKQVEFFPSWKVSESPPLYSKSWTEAAWAICCVWKQGCVWARSAHCVGLILTLRKGCFVSSGRFTASTTGSAPSWCCKRRKAKTPFALSR